MASRSYLGDPVRPHFTIETVGGIERIRVTTPRNVNTIITAIFALLLFGAIEAFILSVALNSRFDWFGAGMVAVGTLIFLGSVHGLAEALWGRETIRVAAGVLEARYGLWPLGEVRRFEPRSIRNLRATDRQELFMVTPLFTSRFVNYSVERGGVTFDDDGEACFLAHDLDRAQGAEVVAWLRSRLPGGAFTDPA